MGMKANDVEQTKLLFFLLTELKLEICTFFDLRPKCIKNSTEIQNLWKKFKFSVKKDVDTFLK